jgi:hypothetical protein
MIWITSWAINPYPNEHHDQGLDPRPARGHTRALLAEDARGTEQGEQAVAGAARVLERVESGPVIVVLHRLVRKPGVAARSSHPATDLGRG